MPKRSVKDNAIIAPGGGTKEDVSNLARDLGMDPTAVLEVLNSQGAGVRVSRSSAAATPASASSSFPTPMTNAWADFMNEEGAAVSSGVEVTTSNKRTKTSPTKSSPSSKTKTISTSSHSYNLPIQPRMKIQSSSKTGKSSNEEDSTFPTPGVLAQTGTLDAAIVGRKKSTLTSPQDLMEPTLLLYSSIFSKTPIALIATSSSACHSIAIDMYGDAYAWGRNECGQCGNTNGTFSACVPMPTRIPWDKSGEEKFVGAAVGKSHSVLISAGGQGFAVGSNKVGQCGVNTAVESIPNWKKCVFLKEGVKASSNDRDSIRAVQVQFLFVLPSFFQQSESIQHHYSFLDCLKSKGFLW
jgi:hypothetical protein